MLGPLEDCERLENSPLDYFSEATVEWQMEVAKSLKCRLNRDM